VISEKMPGGYVVRDANGQALALVYAPATMATPAIWRSPNPSGLID